ncbi:hypothetical protein [Thalassobacillus hwangdonensis]|uniref:Uncharacterized protein n=1 Tax=Thalassobacillus hwangdonensis TaxID=546108 RepID=A0ABW3L2Z7_9BACI
MKYKSIVLIIGLVIFGFIGLLYWEGEDTVEEREEMTQPTPPPVEPPEILPYEGEPLTIAVVGQAPDIKEEALITFEEMEFDKLTELDESSYDAAFIMKDHHERAAEPGAALTYKQSNLPFFFIESEKMYFTYTLEKQSYENAPENEYFIIGYHSNRDGTSNFWQIGEVDKKAAEKEYYSQVFSMIEHQSNSQIAPYLTELIEAEEHFTHILHEENGHERKIVFYQVQKGDKKGIGLALYERDTDVAWQLKEFTSEFIGLGELGSGSIQLDSSSKLVYGYENSWPMHQFEKVDELSEGKLLVRNSMLTYAIVDNNQTFTVERGGYDTDTW